MLSPVCEGVGGVACPLGWALWFHVTPSIPSVCLCVLVRFCLSPSLSAALSLCHQTQPSATLSQVQRFLRILSCLGVSRRQRRYIPPTSWKTGKAGAQRVEGARLRERGRQPGENTGGRTLLVAPQGRLASQSQTHRVSVFSPASQLSWLVVLATDSW